jgi:hypothetical protein
MAHPVTDALASATSHAERHAIKAAAFVALPKADRKVKVGRYTVALVDHPVIGPSGLLQFNVKITKGGKDVTPLDMNPVRVWNPPTLVDDPAGDVVRSWIDPGSGLPQTRTLREDPLAALLTIAGNLTRGLP